MLITVEGLDGAGKTTLIAGLARELGATALREPGGVELSERIRLLVADPELRVDPRAEALLYAAARAQLVAERLRPLLDEGEPAGGEFFARVAHTYDALAAAEPDRFTVLDATEDPDTVLAAALKALS